MTSSGSLSVKPEPDGADNIYRSLLIVLQIIMVVELAVLLIDGFWLNALLVLAIMALTIVPILLGSRLPVKIPSEFQILTIIFVFASLFLGEVRSHMRPRFVALFAFVFAVTVGTFWEVFEFGVDQLFGTTMQKPSLGDPSGLTDTMWDLIINAIAACAISVFGWSYIRSEKQSFIEQWIDKFITNNRHLFRNCE
jgi:hypothetical protein